MHYFLEATKQNHKKIPYNETYERSSSPSSRFGSSPPGKKFVKVNKAFVKIIMIILTIKNFPKI